VALHLADLGVAALLVGAGCAATFVAMQRRLRRALSERLQATERQLSALDASIRALEARAVEFDRIPQLQAAAEPVVEMDIAAPAEMETDHAQDEEVTPEIMAVIAAAANAFLGQKVRILSAKLLESPVEVVSPCGYSFRPLITCAPEADASEKSPEERTRNLKLQITIEGKTYEVEVELLEDDANPRPPSYETYIPVPATLQSMAEADARSQSEEAQEPADQEKLCCSPINGLVIRVIVEPGQQVEANDLIVVLEAMKMETNVTAPRAGTVKAVCVAPGDPVKLNQVIVEFE